MKKRDTIWRILLIITALIIVSSFSQSVYAKGINKKSISLRQGKSYTLKVKGAKKVKWSSKKKAVAAVNSKGRVTAKKPGKTTIIAKVGKKKYTCKVTVLKKATQKKVQATTQKKVQAATQKKTQATTQKKAQATTQKKTQVTTQKKTQTTAQKATQTTAQKATQTTAQKATQTTTQKTSVSTLSPREQEVYYKLIAQKSAFPEGKFWTNYNYYRWNGGIYTGGYGCSAFAFYLSDAAFGTAPARTHTNFNNIKVGDIVRLEYNTHSVIVLGVSDGNLTVAEGNYNYSIHWGRVIPLSHVKSTGTYVMTRY